MKARREKSAQRYEEQYAKSPIGLLKKAREKIESLTQQLESARKDAERYRFLCTERRGWIKPPLDPFSKNDKERLDKAIDKAMNND